MSGRAQAASVIRHLVASTPGGPATTIPTAADAPAAERGGNPLPAHGAIHFQVVSEITRGHPDFTTYLELETPRFLRGVGDPENGDAECKS